MALTEAISSYQFSFEDCVAVSWENSWSAFSNSGFCSIRTQGNDLNTDDIEQGHVEAMTVFEVA